MKNISLQEPHFLFLGFVAKYKKKMYRQLLRSFSFSLTKRTNIRRMSTLSERYFADENPPFSRLEAKPFFETLDVKEKRYAH